MRSPSAFSAPARAVWRALGRRRKLMNTSRVDQSTPVQPLLWISLGRSGILLGCVGLVLGCGGSGGRNTGPNQPSQPTITSVTVSCASPTIQVEQTTQCTATVQGTGSYSSAVIWSVNNTAGGDTTIGTISTAGLYTAPDPIPSTGSAITITATSQSDSSKSNSAQISLAYPTPTLTSVSPSSVSVGTATTIMTLAGTGFSRASAVGLDGMSLTVIFVSTGGLSATVPASAAALAGNHTVTVSNPTPGGGTSNSEPFSINNLVPSISSLNPSTIPDDSPDTQIQIMGSNFLPGSNVSADASMIASTYVSATELIATIPAADLTSTGIVAISVSNSGPGGGASPRAILTVGSQLQDGPGVQQDGALDPQALRYLVGPPAGSSVTSLLAPQSGHDGLTSASRRLSISSMSVGTSLVDQPQHLCSEIGPHCVSGVPWAPQVQPASTDPNGPNGPGDWQHTANCGPASVLMVHSKLCSTTLDMYDELVSINDFLNAAADCSSDGPCLFSPYDGQIDTTQVISTSTGIATFYNGRVVSAASQLQPCMEDPSGRDCPGGGLATSDLAQLAESDLGLNAQRNQISVSGQGSSQQDCPSQMTWLMQELDAGAPVIVHVDYKLGLDPNVGNAGHYMVLVGVDGASCTNTVYVVDPGVSNPANGDYTNQTTISSDNSTGSAPCNGTTCIYTVGQFLESWARHDYDALTLSGKSQACASPAPPLGIVAASLNALTTGQVAVAYSATFVANNGVKPYAWTLVSGQGILPPGIQLNGSTGSLSGTPTSQGTYTFTVQVTDADQNVASGVTAISIAAAASPLTVTTPGELAPATIGNAYSFPLSASGGSIPYHWSASGVTCPNDIPGLSGVCISDNGTIQGTPTSSTNSAVSFSLHVNDSGTTQQTANKTVNLAVLAANAPPQVYSVTASPSTVSEGGTSTVTCNAVDPQQLSLSYVWTATGGTVLGSGASVTWTAPLAPGGYTATCTATSSANLSASGATVIQVGNSSLNSNVAPSTGTVNVTQFTVTGSGATQSGGITATITLPNASTAIVHTTANGSGQYSFGPFTEGATGIYSEVDSDDASGAKSNVVSWTVSSSAPTVSSVSPSPVPGSTTRADADHQRLELRQRGHGHLPRSAGQLLSRPRHHLRQRRRSSPTRRSTTPTMAAPGR